ncbi:hypothetical protein ABZ622_39605 [Streptomyces sp. NPDC007164]|uniref:hypothetical protein n=1 Tax=Streptomyces sp. NPDC007164 TaxID=3156918 RepID=UPI0033CF2435
MIETVIQLFTQMAGGTVTAAGAGASQAVIELVRERLTRSGSGQAALQAVDEHPQDPAAGSQLRSLLQAEVDSDPDFGRQIAAIFERDALEVDVHSARSTSGSVTFDNSTVRGRNNTIALGPVTSHNTRNVRFSLLAVALVFAALVALGIYRGVQAVTDDGRGERSVAALGSGAARQVLPEPLSLPGGWELSSGPETAGNGMAQSLGVKYVETVTFSMGTSDAEAKFQVAAASGVSEAHAFFESAANRASSRRLEVPRVGDESLAETAPSDDGKHQDKVMMLRVGTVILIISGISIEEQPFETARLEILGKMMAERAQQAQNGQAPVASARNA